MGWRRASRYTWLRIIRLSDTTHGIAMGLAIGSLVSFNPLLGTHFIQAIIFAWLLRANILCAFIGTFIGNPWTYPFIWWAGINFGSHLFFVIGLPASETLPSHLDLHVLWDLIMHDPLRILLPWTIGGVLLGFVSMPFVYIVSYKIVRAGKIARAKARHLKMHPETR